MMRVVILMGLVFSQVGSTMADDPEGDGPNSNRYYKFWVPGRIVSIIWNRSITYDHETWTFGEWHQYLTSWSWDVYAEYNARSTKWTYEEWMSFYNRNEKTWSGVVWSLYELGFRSLGQIARLVQEILMDRLAARLLRARI